MAVMPEPVRVDYQELYDDTVVVGALPDVEDALMYAHELAIHFLGSAELIICPNHLVMTHVTHVAQIKGTPRDFNAGSNIQLSDGCWLV